MGLCLPIALAAATIGVSVAAGLSEFNADTDKPLWYVLLLLLLVGTPVSSVLALGEEHGWRSMRFGWIRDPERAADGLLVEQPPAVNAADPRRHVGCHPSESHAEAFCGYGLTVRRAKL
jgi:hypothetical protein